MRLSPEGVFDLGLEQSTHVVADVVLVGVEAGSDELLLRDVTPGPVAHMVPTDTVCQRLDAYRRTHADPSNRGTSRKLTGGSLVNIQPRSKT